MEMVNDKNNKEVVASEEVLELPPELDGKKIRKEKFSKYQLFSPAIFKESLKSNWIGTLICSIGNALILVIIVVILSTLSINATKDSLSNMFSNANMETEIKTGAVGLYSSFDESAENYEDLSNGTDKAVELSETIYLEMNDSDIQTLLTSLNTAYDSVYNHSGKNPDNTKATIVAISNYYLNGGELSTAQKNLLSLLGITIPDVNLTDQEKIVAIYYLPYYLDEYYIEGYTNGEKNATAVNVRNIMVNSIPTCAENGLTEENFGLSKDQAKEISALLKTQIVDFNTTLDSKGSISETEKKSLALEKAYDASFDLIPLMSDESTKDQVTTIMTELKACYDKTDDSGKDYKKMYIEDTDSYRTDSMSEIIENTVVDAFRNIAYYNYLNAFEVNYVTDDLGYPIEYIESGKYDEKGEPIKVAVRITKYNPDRYITVKADMGTPATLVQKMHKDLLTGEDYTEEEIEKAKKDSNEQIDTQIVPNLKSFMSDFIKRDSKNSNEYFDGNKVNEIAIADRVNSIVGNMAAQQLIDSYNDKHGTSITDVSQITYEDSSMDGKSMMDSVYAYSSGGISSFRYLYSSNLEKGYKGTDALLAAMVKSCTGVIDQLPNKVNDSLTEMGSMNTYGIFVGVVAFGMASILIPMVYTITLADSLVAEKVETGSLAFTMSTPIKRSTFIFTEACYLIGTEVFMGLVLFLGGLLARTCGIAMGGTDLIESLPVSDISQYALGNFMVTLAISGICFCASSIFNKVRFAISYGGGLNIFFFICSILGLFGTKAIPGTVRIESMNYFNYVTILSLNDGVAVMEASAVYWYKLIGLLAIALLTYISGSIVFTKKDLPL